MDDLRLILLFAGIAVIAGIYAWDRFKHRSRQPRRRRARPSAAHRRAEDEAPDDGLLAQELERMQASVSSRDMPPDDVSQQTDIGDGSDQAETSAEAGTEEDLLVISVVSVSGEPFSGEALARAFANNKLFYGERAIFHRFLRQGGEDRSVFGVANLFKPGHFGNGELEGFETAGITLFLELPAPVDGLKAFDDFVQTAERLAVELGGQLQDREHCVITHQALMQKREVLARSRLRIPLSA